MNKQATVLSKPHCPACERAKAMLVAHGYELQVIDADDFKANPMKYPERCAMQAALAMGDNALPVVKVGNADWEPWGDIAAKIAG